MKVRLSDSGGVGIVSIGHYIPYLRLEMNELARQWDVPAPLERAYRLNGRNRVAVNADDEDTVTLAVAAAERALATLPKTVRISSVLVGSESHPYAVKPSAVIVAEALGLAPDVFASDLEFACKGGTAAVLLSTALVKSSFGAYALAVGADCPQSAPGSLLEASVGAGACAVVIGPEGEAIATIEAAASAGTDLTDFWRRDGSPYPSVVGKFSVDEGYMAHSERVARALFEATGSSAADYAACVFHQPYASLPSTLAKSLGFTAAQAKPGLIASRIGNTYSGSSLLALASVLEGAKAGDRILLVSFGSGAGSDGFVLRVAPAIAEWRKKRHAQGLASIEVELGREHADTLSYGQYARAQGKLAR